MAASSAGRTAPGQELAPPPFGSARKPVPDAYWTFSGGVVRDSFGSRVGSQPPARSSSCGSHRSLAPTSARSSTSRPCVSARTDTSSSYVSAQTDTSSSSTTRSWFETRNDHADAILVPRTPRVRKEAAGRRSDSGVGAPENCAAWWQASTRSFHPPIRDGRPILQTRAEGAAEEFQAQQENQRVAAGQREQGGFFDPVGFKRKPVVWGAHLAGLSPDPFAGQSTKRSAQKTGKKYEKVRDDIDKLMAHKEDGTSEDAARGLAVVVNDGKYFSLTAGSGMATATWAEPGLLGTRVADTRFPKGGVNFCARKKMIQESGISLRNASGAMHTAWAEKQMHTVKQADPSGRTTKPTPRGMKQSKSDVNVVLETPRPLRKTESVGISKFNIAGGPDGEVKSGWVGAKRGAGLFGPAGAGADPITNRHLGEEDMFVDDKDVHRKGKHRPQAQNAAGPLHMARRKQQDPRASPLAWTEEQFPREVADHEFARYVKAGGESALMRRALVDLKHM